MYRLKIQPVRYGYGREKLEELGVEILRPFRGLIEDFYVSPEMALADLDLSPVGGPFGNSVDARFLLYEMRRFPFPTLVLTGLRCFDKRGIYRGQAINRVGGYVSTYLDVFDLIGEKSNIYPKTLILRGVHETGHAFGLCHPHKDDQVTGNGKFCVMDTTLIPGLDKGTIKWSDYLSAVDIGFCDECLGLIQEIYGNGWLIH